MFDIEFNNDGQVAMQGRLDAANAPTALQFLDQVSGDCVINMAQLDYISSAGLGVLLQTHKRLMASGAGLKLIEVNHHISDIFSYSGFDQLFDIVRRASP